MLDSTVELLAGLCLIAPPLMISFCIVGSIVAALRPHQRVTDGFKDQPELSI
jgi:hypothetical protein